MRRRSKLLGEEVLELDDALLGLEATLVGDHGADGRDRAVAPALEVVQAVDRHVEDVGDDLDRQRHGEGGDEFDRPSPIQRSMRRCTMASTGSRNPAIVRGVK